MSAKRTFHCEDGCLVAGLDLGERLVERVPARRSGREHLGRILVAVEQGLTGPVSGRFCARDEIVDRRTLLIAALSFPAWMRREWAAMPQKLERARSESPMSVATHEAYPMGRCFKLGAAAQLERNSRVRVGTGSGRP